MHENPFTVEELETIAWALTHDDIDRPDIAAKARALSDAIEPPEPPKPMFGTLTSEFLNSLLLPDEQNQLRSFVGTELDRLALGRAIHYSQGLPS